MNYAILINSNGSYLIKEEGIADLERARAKFHHWCEIYHDASDVNKAIIMLADENLDAVEGKKEFIKHEVTASE